MTDVTKAELLTLDFTLGGEVFASISAEPSELVYGGEPFYALEGAMGPGPGGSPSRIFSVNSF